MQVLKAFGIKIVWVSVLLGFLYWYKAHYGRLKAEPESIYLNVR